jgi:hypothetical protein
VTFGQREATSTRCAYPSKWTAGISRSAIHKWKPCSRPTRDFAVLLFSTIKQENWKRSVGCALLLDVMVKRLRLHLGRIEDELRDVQRHFPAINAVLNCRRDDFSDTVRQNMLTAYEFLDAVVDEDLDLFSDEGLEVLLQLNHLVLLGRGYDPRAFGRHISVTRRQFFDNFRRYVKPIRRWYRKHVTENPYKVASQVYVGVLSQPQLYQEGNHRTGSLIASGILLQNGCPPFVLTRQNAVAYFNPSSEIKFSDKRTIRGKLRLPKYQNEFREFLQQNVNQAYVR